MRNGGVPSRESETRFFEQLPRELEKTTAAEPPTLHPGVKDLLTILAKYPRIVVGLVTGNIEPDAIQIDGGGPGADLFASTGTPRTKALVPP